MAHRLLLDVSSLMYRSFFAMGDMVRSPAGRSVGAVHGYLDMVARLLVSRHPDEVVHAYDHEWRPVARTDNYPDYKANRPPVPDGLPEQFAMLRQVLDLAGMPQAMTRGWEAEDAIASLCAGAADAEVPEGARRLDAHGRDAVEAEAPVHRQRDHAPDAVVVHARRLFEGRRRQQPGADG